MKTFRFPWVVFIMCVQSIVCGCSGGGGNAVISSNNSSVITANSGYRYYESSAVPTLVSPTSTGVTYYIDGTNGNDSYDGLAATYDGTHGPFQTINNALNHYTGRLAGGNTFKIRSGIYRELVDISGGSGGTVSKPITIGPYGDGEVIIDASTAVTGWTSYSGSIYQAVPNFTPKAVVVNDVPLKPVDPTATPPGSLANLSEGQWYFDGANLYLWCSGGVNPASQDVVVVKDSESDTAVNINNVSYVYLYGLTVRGAGGNGVAFVGDYPKIEMCNLEFNGKSGVAVYTSPGYTLSPGAQVVRNNIYFNMLRNWPRGGTQTGNYSYGGWSPGIAIMSAANAYIAGNIISKTGGEGIAIADQANSPLVEDNIVHDNFSVEIYFDNITNPIARRNLTYTTLPVDLTDAYANSGTPDAATKRRLIPTGIAVADEKYPDLNYGSTSSGAQIYDNIIINASAGFSNWYETIDGLSGLKHVLFANNTILVPDGQNYGGVDFLGIDIPYNNGNNTGTTFINNIVYGTYATSSLVWIEGGASEHGASLSNNLYYSVNSTTPFAYTTNLNKYSFTDWKTVSGQDANSVNSDPLFSGGADPFDPSSYMLSATSPAIGMGTTLSVFSIDFNSFTKKTPWTAGALDPGSVYAGTSN